jgi:hypothetical protein
MSRRVFEHEKEPSQEKGGVLKQLQLSQGSEKRVHLIFGISVSEACRTLQEKIRRSYMKSSIK